MNEEQINEAMRLADEIADYAWKEGLSDGAYSNATQDRECRAESRAELEAYLRTIAQIVQSECIGFTPEDDQLNCIVAAIRARSIQPPKGED